MIASDSCHLSQYTCVHSIGGTVHLCKADIAPTRLARRGVCAIILAAGRAERLGSSKLSLQLAGRSILRHVIDSALASNLSEIVVVLGHYARELVSEIPDDRRVRSVHNARYDEGQHSSVKAGLAVLDGEAEAAVVLLGDQPFVTPEAINAIIDEFQMRRTPLVLPIYQGRRGHPVLFSSALFPELLEASEEQGRREVVRRHMGRAATVALAQEPPMDVDTWQDYLQLANRPIDACFSENRRGPDYGRGLQ